MKDLEAKLEQDFRDWLGWNEQPAPKEDDPDYYTYTWGLTVWVNCAKQRIKNYKDDKD